MQLPCGDLVRMDLCSSREWRSPQGLRRFLWWEFFTNYFFACRPSGAWQTPFEFVVLANAHCCPGKVQW
jgi:hypothetical protein